MTKKLLPLLIGLALITAACSTQGDESGATEERKIPIQVATITTGQLQEDHHIPGQLSPSLELTVIPKASGQLMELYVERGDHVEAGQALAKLDERDLQQAYTAEVAALEQARIQLQSAQVARNKAEQGLNNAKINLEQAKLNLSDTEDDTEAGTDTLDNDTIQRKQLTLQYEEAKKNLERMKSLYESGDVSLQQYESALTAEQNAALALEQAQISTQQSKQTREQAEIALSNAEQDINQADLNIAQAETSLKQAELRVEQARQRLEDATITAPAAGEIVAIEADEGEMINAQSPIFTIVAYDPILLKTTVSARQLPLIKKDMSVTIEISSLAALASEEVTMEGKVLYVSPVTDSTGLYPIEVEIPNPNHTLKPGMIASLRIPETLVDNSLILPTSAIVEEAGFSYVYIVEQDRAVLKEVKIISAQTEQSAVEGDIEAGDQVVVKGQITLTDGNLVTIVKEDDN